VNNNDTLILPANEDNPNARRVGLSMQVTSVIHKETGQQFDFKFARFERDDGVEILFPWEQLKQIVLEWIEIDKEDSLG